MRRLHLLAFVLAVPAVPARALEIRFHPPEVVYTYEVDPARQLTSVVLQNIAVVQEGAGSVTLDTLEIQVLAQGQVTQTLVVSAGELEASAQRMHAMAGQGVLKLYDFYFQTSRYMDGLAMAPDRNLKPGTALVTFGKPMLLVGAPDKVEVVARGTDGAGKAVAARGSVRVATHKSPNQYHLPLSGTWWVAGGPNFHSHHRWVANEEFAFDLVGLGGDGRAQKGAGLRLDDYYGYGKDVRAVADGVVVEVATDATEANDRLRQPGESTEAYDQRTVAAQNQLLARSIRAPLGNFVVIRHSGEEFSHSVHLKQGSVKVRAGDLVKRGQVIGQVGHTGNSTAPHLHFQLTDGPDPMYSRGLPIVFADTWVEGLGLDGRPLQTGWIVNTKP